MNAKELKNIKSKISQAIDRKNAYMTLTADSKNPDIIEIRTRNDGELSTLYAISNALKGNLALLNILASGVLYID